MSLFCTIFAVQIRVKTHKYIPNRCYLNENIIWTCCRMPKETFDQKHALGFQITNEENACLSLKKQAQFLKLHLISRLSFAPLENDDTWSWQQLPPVLIRIVVCPNSLRLRRHLLHTLLYDHCAQKVQSFLYEIAFSFSAGSSTTHQTPSQGFLAIRSYSFVWGYIGIFQIVSLQSWEEVVIFVRKTD